MTPIFKKGKRSNSANYRPVSLTIILCQVLESLIRDKVIDHLNLYKVIKDTQHGFVKNRSCLTNLLVFLEEVTADIIFVFNYDISQLRGRNTLSERRSCSRSRNYLMLCMETYLIRQDHS